MEGCSIRFKKLEKSINFIGYFLDEFLLVFNCE